MLFSCFALQSSSPLLCQACDNCHAVSHLDIAKSQLGINKNDNRKQVMLYLKTVNINRYANWCAAFVRYCLDNSGRDVLPRSAVAQHYINSKSIKAIDVYHNIKKVDSSYIVIWKRGETWQGHIGFVLTWSGKKGTTIEGNTSNTNTAAGGYVQRKNRIIQPYNYFRITHFTKIQ